MSRDIYGNLTKWFTIPSNKIFFTTTDQLERNLKQQPKIELHIWNLSFSHKDQILGFEAFSPFARKDTVRGKSMSFQMWIHLCRVINSE